MNLRRNKKWLIGMGCCLLSLLQLSVVVAQDTLGEGIDCTAVSVDYSDDPSLTKEERLRKMDEAFFDSLNKFELCQSMKLQQSSSSAGSGGGGGGGGDQGGGQDGGQSSDQQDGGQSSDQQDGIEGAEGQSTASTAMKGTEKAEIPKEVDSEDPNLSEADVGQMTAKGERKSGGNMSSSNGKSPEDIPAAENDDLLAAQIRYAAENETDPVKKKQLWNEYRKYKGLAPK